MTGIGIFVIGYALTQLLALSSRPGLPIWRRGVAAARYLSYRGFHIKSLGWNSAPIGVLFLGVVAAIYFFCTPDIALHSTEEDPSTEFCKAWNWLHLHTIGRVRTPSGETRLHSELDLAGCLWHVCHFSCESNASIYPPMC